MGKVDWDAMDETFTIAPPRPCAIIFRPNVWLHKKVETRLTCSTRSHCATVICSERNSPTLPALLIRISTAPNSASTNAAQAWTDAASPTSV